MGSRTSNEVRMAFTTLSRQVEEYVAAMERIKIKEGIRLVMSVSADGNKFLQVRVY